MGDMTDNIESAGEHAESQERYDGKYIPENITTNMSQENPPPHHYYGESQENSSAIPPIRSDSGMKPGEWRLMKSQENKLKLCPFCGELHVSNGKMVELECQSESTHPYCIHADDWNSAWAHKRIAELEREVEELKNGK